MAECFPLFMDIRNKKILVAGGGRVALRRITVLLEFGPRIFVVAKEPCPEIECLARQGKLSLEKRPFAREDIDGTELFLLAATSDWEQNREICRAGREKGILVNSASDHRECDFYFPAIAKEEGLVLGISGNGKNHREVAQTAAGVRKWLAQGKDSR